MLAPQSCAMQAVARKPKSWSRCHHHIMTTHICSGFNNQSFTEVIRWWRLLNTGDFHRDYCFRASSPVHPGRSEVVIGNACRLSWPVYCISKWTLTMWQQVLIRWIYVQYVLKGCLYTIPWSQACPGAGTRPTLPLDGGPLTQTGGKLHSTHAALMSRRYRDAQPRVTHSQLEYNQYKMNILLIYDYVYYQYPIIGREAVERSRRRGEWVAVLFKLTVFREGNVWYDWHFFKFQRKSSL